MAVEICPICLTIVNRTVDGLVTINCRRCGVFKITKQAEASLMTDFEDECYERGLGAARTRMRANASAWIRRNPWTRVDVNSIPFLRGIQAPTYLERADDFLVQIANRIDRLDGDLNLETESWIAGTWSIDESELAALYDLVRASGWIESTSISMMDVDF